MVNGNYVLYGDRPSSESEIVDDHVHPRISDRKVKRKFNRTANELQHSLNQAQLDNDTDSVKYEKKVKEPRLLRYVPTTEVEENFVTEKFETYDLKPAEERPRRYAFTKKARNPADGSINYAYSRSSSSCSSPNGNLPTISEHCEQYGAYRISSVPGTITSEISSGYEAKMDKYFSKPKEVKNFAAKGSHPDNLYRIPTDSGVGAGKMSRCLRILRWPAALLVVCIALALFVYFLMPNSYEAEVETLNTTYWEAAAAGINSQLNQEVQTDKQIEQLRRNPDSTDPKAKGSIPLEIEFYSADKNIDLSFVDPISNTISKRIITVAPVFPSHVTPEVQYGNEKADIGKLRSPKLYEEVDVLPEDSTLKPHITQKPEKPLEIYFKDTTTMSAEAIARAETINDLASFENKHTTKKASEIPIKPYPSIRKDHITPEVKQSPIIIKETVDIAHELLSEVEEFINRPADVKFTSGHSKLFGISIEDAAKMKSTTQSSLYNTRVSPTLPTWRDGDDTTTKHYPINVNLEVPQCRSTSLTLCRGVLPYDLASSPANIAGIEVTSLMSQIEFLVATNCSDRVRHFFCALLEPECNPPPYPTKMPCHNLCKAIVDSCDGLIPQELTPAFKCQHYLRSNCVAAKTPCYSRELTCGDGSCVPREWICDGTEDCPSGEDEATCVACDKHEFRCRSGDCIQKRWVCDGYPDCINGDDEDDYICAARESNIPVSERQTEPGEELAGSAPAPAIHKPNKASIAPLKRGTENDSSQELLVTSDSTNPYKRNFTRRPSPSRLSPYTRYVSPPSQVKLNSGETTKNPQMKKQAEGETTKKTDTESMEDVNIEDLGFFEDLKKELPDKTNKRVSQRVPSTMTKSDIDTTTARVPSTRLDKSINKLERVINGATLLKKADAETKLDAAIYEDSREMNAKPVRKSDMLSESRGGSSSAHASPCPSGELRCVDGRCITLSQLCDGTVDCSDHADEDNCYT